MKIDSDPRTCPPCLLGNHRVHDFRWNLKAFRPRGAYCPCEGECVQLPDPVARMFDAYRERD
jgi:hypothetical protein